MASRLGLAENEFKNDEGLDPLYVHGEFVHLALNSDELT